MLRAKSQKPTKTVDDLREAEEQFISDNKADVGEKSVKEPVPELKPTKEVKKTKSAKAAETAIGIIDLHQYVYRAPWPIINLPKPSYAEGRDDIDKPFIMRVKENRWLSIERHCQALGISKTQWVLHACDMLMAAEQEWFEKNQEKVKSKVI
jgi:hypothetical protein